MYVKFIWEKAKGTLSFVVLDAIFWNFLYYPCGYSGEFWVLSPCVLRVYSWLFAGITPGGALLTICGTGESSQGWPHARQVLSHIIFQAPSSLGFFLTWLVA